ncbi:MAG: hypothetical protein U0235_30940 [Polyangiaceae bacterium]
MRGAPRAARAIASFAAAWLATVTACVAASVGTPDGDASADAAALDGGADERGAVFACDAAGPVRTVAQLPAGACVATSTCSLPVWHPCPCAKEHAGIDGYECRCVDASWQCERTAVGATACLLDAECRDRSVDAARGD